MKTIKFPILWVDDPQRIKALFVKEHERRIWVRSIGQELSFDLLEGENVEETKDKIGKSLAGQPVGDTSKILKEILGT